MRRSAPLAYLMRFWLGRVSPEMTMLRRSRFLAPLGMTGCACSACDIGGSPGASGGAERADDEAGASSPLPGTEPAGAEGTAGGGGGGAARGGEIERGPEGGRPRQ